MKRRNVQRDKFIRKTYKKGLGGHIGRGFNITRQRVNQIIHGTHQNGNLLALARKVMVKVKWLFMGD